MHRAEQDMLNNHLYAPNNGAVLIMAQIIKTVMSSAAEVEIGALYINSPLEKMGHTQSLTAM